LDNLIINPNLTEGLWSQKVGDCNNYDDDGSIAQYLTDDIRDNGKSLQLEAVRHTACTGPKQMKVKEATTYMLSFDYESDNAKEAGLYIGYNGTSTENISERIPIKNKEWNTYTKLIKIPLGASSVSMSLYAYEKDGETSIKVNYDNFYFSELPEINNKYYLLTDPDLKLAKPKQITFHLINPTKKLTHIVGASTSFYLTMSESYHPQWQAELNNNKVSGRLNSWIPFVSPDIITEENHFKLDGFLNGWYIDPIKLCTDENGKVREGCKLNADGSYDIEMIIEFTPQRWFYVGLIISVTTLVSCIIYLLYSSYKSRRSKRIGTEKLNAWYHKETNL
jgi:hypothetical protein